MMKIIRSFFRKKTLINAIPRYIIFIILNLRYLKKYNTLNGSFYLPFFAFQDVIRNTIIKNKIYEEEVYNAVKKKIKPNSIVLDIGSNYGQMSILWSKVKQGVQVYSFEASSYIFTILKKNIEINNANVKAFNNIVGNVSDKLAYISKSKLDKYTSYGSNKLEFTKEKKNSDKIECIKIDDIAFNQNISVMKIDVQGFDLHVLKGAKETIKKYEMPIIFEYDKELEKDFNYNFRDFQNFLEEIKYKIILKIDKNNYLIEKE